jgi:glycosyltransferase involved in cell wall biosynthesis
LKATVLMLAGSAPDPGALGGVSVHVAALAAHAPRGLSVVTAFPHAGELSVEQWGPRRLVAVLPLPGAPGSQEASLSLERAIVAAVVGTGADVLHIHSPLLGADVLRRAIEATGVRAVLTLHDHSVVCENYTLLEGGERHCGIPVDLRRCDSCLTSAFGRPPGSVPGFRESMSRLVSAVDAVVAPSASVLELAARVHPALLSRARRIAWGVPEARVRCTRSAEEAGPLRLAIVGKWAAVKGAERVPALLAACRELDVEWHLFGATDGASLRRVRASTRRVIVHGAYQRDALAHRLARAGCHLALLPSVFAESFSLVLSELIAAGLPVIASDLGALGERVREGRLGWTFDPWAPAEFAAIVGRLARGRAEIDELAAHVRAVPHRSEGDMARDHAVLFEELAQKGNVRDDEDDQASGSGPDSALAAYRRGVAALASRPPSRLADLVDRLRRTDFYRDLPLRRLLPEKTRKKVEAAMSQIFRERR